MSYLLFCSLQWIIWSTWIGIHCHESSYKASRSRLQPISLLTVHLPKLCGFLAKHLGIHLSHTFWPLRWTGDLSRVCSCLSPDDCYDRLQHPCDTEYTEYTEYKRFFWWMDGWTFWLFTDYIGMHFSQRLFDTGDILARLDARQTCLWIHAAHGYYYYYHNYNLFI